MIVVLHFKVTHNVLRIGDGADFTRKLYYYKLIFGTSKIVKLTIPSHCCQYDVLVAQPKILKINFVNIITKFYITI